MKYAIGIDMGGTKIEGCLVDEKGKILDLRRIQTESKKGKTKVLNNLIGLIQLLEHSTKKKISGVGIGFPGFCDSKGKIVNSPNVPLQGFNLRNHLKKKIKLPIYIENDANCFAMAEHTFGAGKGSNVMVGLIIGTGIGAGIIINGKPFSGCAGGAGEVGHNLHDLSARKLSLGKNDFESVCSGPGIIKNYKILKGKIKRITTKEIFSSKDIIARKVIDLEYRNLAIHIGTLVNVLNPDCIVLGGGVGNALNIKRLQKELIKFSEPFSGSKVKLKKDKVSDSLGALGAASIVFKS